MRMMSFALTERQLMDGTKTVTRRTGWESAHVGEHLLAVRKSMGLKKGEKAVVLCEIVVLSVRRKPLNAVNYFDVTLEGFPEWADRPEEFVAMFRKHMRVPSGPYDGPKSQARMRPMAPYDLVTVIEFGKVPGSERVPVQASLAEVNAGADRATKRVDAWPQWKKDVTPGRAL